MPIKIPNALPAYQTLTDENIFVMTETRARTQDIRPLQILILNLMPKKVETETQLARLLGNTPLQVEVEFIHTRTHRSRITSQSHLLSFYRTFDQVQNRNFDGMIITGAPVENLEFEEVEYWQELCEIMEWSKTHVHSTFHICWAAQAGLYYHFQISKQQLPQKLFGVYPHQVDYRRSILFRGFDDTFQVPQSRYTTVSREEIAANPRLHILASSPEAGIYAVSTKHGKQIFITGHSEYDTETLDAEYRRDQLAGLHPNLPAHYYPHDDDTQPPQNTWRSHANLLFSNWLNYFVYQTTPYEIVKVGQARTSQLTGHYENPSQDSAKVPKNEGDSKRPI